MPKSSGHQHLSLRFQPMEAPWPMGGLSEVESVAVHVVIRRFGPCKTLEELSVDLAKRRQKHSEGQGRF